MAKLVSEIPAALDGYAPNRLSYEGRKQWLDIRKLHIGGSESATLLGHGMFDSMFSMYMDKTGQKPDDFSDSTRMQWGRRLEYSIRDGIAQDLQYDPDDCLYMEDTYLWANGPARLGSTPDAILAYPSYKVIEALGEVAGPGVFEIKNTDSLVHKQKWVDDEPPIQYIVQLQHYMAVTGYEWGVLGALVGGNTPYVYFYRRHEPTIEAIKAASVEFWQRVEDGNPPPIDDSLATENTIKAAYPRDNGLEADLTGDNELPELCQQFKEKKAQEKELGSAIRGLRSRIMEKVGDHKKVNTNGYLISAPSRDVEAYMVNARTQRTLTIKELS
jgi:predicted phage-related endonuclease